MARSISTTRTLAPARTVANRPVLRDMPYSLQYGTGKTLSVLVTPGTNPSTTDWSFTSWVYPRFLPKPWFSPTTNHNILAQKDNSGTGRSWLLIDFNIARLNNFASFFSGASQTSNIAAAQNRWQHTGLSYNHTSQTLKYYLNGILVNTVSSVVIESNDGTLVIGNSKDNTSTFQGNICDTKFYESELSADQFKNIHFNNYVYRDRLKFWLLGTDGSGSTITDISGNGFHGSITTATWTTVTPFKASRNLVV